MTTFTNGVPDIDGDDPSLFSKDELHEALIQRATSIGLLILRLAEHGPADWGDCSLNHPVVTVIDKFRPAHELIEALVNMSERDLRGLAAMSLDDLTRCLVPAI
jgi:hypothetical protein